MSNKIDFKKLAEHTWKEFEEARKECANNISNMSNERDIYPQLNKLLGMHDKAMVFSENQYVPQKDGNFRSLFNPSIGFEDTKASKLYDVLIEYFGDKLGVSGMFQIIDMIEAYANIDNNK